MTSKTMMRTGTQRGLSLVELMVAMVIGLIVMIVVYQMFVTSEGTRRTAIAGNDAQMSAAIAMSALQDEIRNAGYGLNSSTLLDCAKVKGWDDGKSAWIDFEPWPVKIDQGADNSAAGVGKLSDKITVVYSDLAYPTVPASFLAGIAAPTADVRVTNRYGIRPGNVLIVSAPGGTVTPVQPGRVCALAETTGAPDAAGKFDLVMHGTGSFKDVDGNTRTARFNSPAGLGASADTPGGLAFAGGDASVYLVHNFGTNPSVMTFSVESNQLMVENRLGGAKQALVEGVVALQAQYGVGVDKDGDDIADVFNPDSGGLDGKWDTVPPAKPGLVLAVRLAVLTRSNLMEAKDKGTGLCNATLAASPELVWAGGSFDVTGIPDWDCYRYKKFEMVVPLRNLLWIPNS